MILQIKAYQEHIRELEAARDLWKGKFENERRHRLALKAKVQRLRKATVYLYNSGYMAGHNDTVEACFTDIYECDMDTYHDDVVAELLTDKALEYSK